MPLFFALFVRINRIHCGIETDYFLQLAIIQSGINRIHCGIET